MLCAVLLRLLLKKNHGDYGYKKPVKNDFIDAPQTKKVQFYLNNENKPVYYLNQETRGTLQPYIETEKGIYFSWGY